MSYCDPHVSEEAQMATEQTGAHVWAHTHRCATNPNKRTQTTSHQKASCNEIILSDSVFVLFLSCRVTGSRSWSEDTRPRHAITKVTHKLSLTLTVIAGSNFESVVVLSGKQNTINTHTKYWKAVDRNQIQFLVLWGDSANTKPLCCATAGKIHYWFMPTHRNDTCRAEQSLSGGVEVVHLLCWRWEDTNRKNNESEARELVPNVKMLVQGVRWLEETCLTYIYIYIHAPMHLCIRAGSQWMNVQWLPPKRLLEADIKATVMNEPTAVYNMLTCAAHLLYLRSISYHPPLRWSCLFVLFPSPPLCAAVRLQPSKNHQLFPFSNFSRFLWSEVWWMSLTLGWPLR